ncbi:hypothetical protein ACHHYP_16428, partial [Achlya hypogyna]
MLRGMPHLGIPLPNDDTSTSIFFADDSTLLSNSLTAAVEQLDIVDEFCSVSGARLNHAKCTTLALNDHLDPADIMADGLLNILPSGQPAKYLGLLFGHRLAADYQVQRLNDKFLAAFQLWGSRARTLQGRKLIATTMLLSLLWHVTAAVHVPRPLVATWQRMVNKYILGRKTSLSDQHRPLIHRTWQFDKILGLGLPHVASKIRSQRLLRLQQLMQPDPPDAPAPWKVLVRRQFSRTMDKLYRATHPFDFLLYYPNHSSKWLFLWELHPLWQDIWRQWALTPMDQRIAVPPSLDVTMNLPMWLTTYDVLLAEPAGHASNVAKNPTIRRWCRHGANNGVRCLKDMLTRQGTWPTKTAFIARMSVDNPAAIVEIAPSGSMVFGTPDRAGLVYAHLTKLVDQVFRTFQVRAGASFPAISTTSHPFVTAVKDQPCAFEIWPKRYVTRLAFHAPADARRHPTTTTTRATKDDIARYMRLVRRTCRIPPPVHGDVWLRLVMHMLPVNSRFHYMQAVQPDAICCVYDNCHAVETQQHALHVCSHVHPLWTFHATAWHCYGVNFDWVTITNLDQFQVAPRGQQHKDALFVLWVLLCASNLHS